MRIAHTVSSLVNRSAGPTYSVPSLARAQASLGTEVFLHSLDGTPKFGRDGLEDVRHERDYKSVPGIGRLGFSRSMHNIIIRGSYDVVHTHGLWLIPNNYFPKDTLFVVSPRGMLTTVALEFSPWKKRIASLLFQDRTLRAAKFFQATALSEYEDVRNYGLMQPVAVVPNGIDIPVIGEHSDVSERRRVVSIGRIHRKKGLDRLIAAWTEIEKRYPEWDLEIIGPNEQDHRSELEALTRKLDLERVKFSDALHDKEKTDVLSSAELFILPSLSENFGISVAESLAAAVPVIATKGAPWEGLEKERCGWWVGHRPSDLAGALAQALALPKSELRAMGMRGRRWMQVEFSWGGIANMTLQAYLWALGRGDKPDFVYVD